jgi:drug/metabolite transporter (DMT)-like permease
MTGTATATLQVVVATILFSFVGPLAKLLPLGAGTIAYWRSVLGLLALAGFAIVSRALAANVRNPMQELAARAPGAPLGAVIRDGFATRHGDIRWKSSASLLLTGLFTAGNWYFYVQAAKVSTVAVAVVVLFTYPLFISLLEPLLFRDKFRWSNVAAGTLVFLGVALLTERFSLENATTLGALYALIASLSFTASSLTNRWFIRHYSATTIMMHQMFTCALVFAHAGWMSGWPGMRVFGWLLLLGAGLTAISQTLYVASLQKLTSSYSSLLVSLQPMYTTLIAVVVLHEVPSTNTAAGGMLILSAVIGTIVIRLWQERARRTKPHAR